MKRVALLLIFGISIISTSGQNRSASIKLNLGPAVYENQYLQVISEIEIFDHASAQFSYYYSSNIQGLSPGLRCYISEAIGGFYFGGMATWLRENPSRKSVLGGGFETGWSHLFGEKQRFLLDMGVGIQRLSTRGTIGSDNNSVLILNVAVGYAFGNK